MVVRAREKAIERRRGIVSFGVGDGTRLPVADASFDVWCSAFVVRNIPDLDAALARKPAVLLVDELAHDNAIGGRHPKRWQDVFELLDAGISADKLQSEPTMLDAARAAVAKAK